MIRRSVVSRARAAGRSCSLRAWLLLTIVTCPRVGGAAISLSRGMTAASPSTLRHDEPAGSREFFCRADSCLVVGIWIWLIVGAYVAAAGAAIRVFCRAAADQHRWELRNERGHVPRELPSGAALVPVRVRARR